MQKLDITVVTSRCKNFFSKSNISWPTYSLIVLFGLGSWIAVNGLWVELPILVKTAPEGWKLPSYLAVIFQLANIGPVIYSISNHFFPRRVHEKSAIPVIVSIGAVSCALLGFYWDKTSIIDGNQHSTVLFILSFFLALVDCTSSVVFLTFMSIFPSTYITALFVGETCSGLLPALVALGQGINSGSKNHQSNVTNNSLSKYTAKDDGLKFGPEGFFFFLFSMMLVCGLAFGALNYLPVAKRQRDEKVVKTNQPTIDCQSEVATLSSIASALTCFAALWIPCSSHKTVAVLSIVYTILGGYTLLLACLSPTPPLYNSDLGSVIIIVVSILSGILVSYSKLSICTIMRNYGYRALFWCGVSIQTGSCIGALIMFPLVNILKLFHSAKS
ncbi:solute carrier family 52, riboflavin transporter, member 3-A-like isoform X2 [Acropora muricata]|uniref:solute carrier family 52, riboflavin transporter, member 3-A-like isoform X2 n=1 Tax=Acropora muricata TaxID=159855 RepID=UPI0034E40862